MEVRGGSCYSAGSIIILRQTWQPHPPLAEINTLVITFTNNNLHNNKDHIHGRGLKSVFTSKADG